MQIVRSYFLAILFAVFFINSMCAQTGIIRGSVVDGDTGEPLVGASVRLLKDSLVKQAVFSDIEGSYVFTADTGSYRVLLSFMSYKNDTIEEVVVKAKEVNVLNTLMFEDIEKIVAFEVFITAKRDQGSNITFYNQKRNAINSIDGVSLDLMQRKGDLDAAAAVRRVVGVTVEGDRYVYVRGLGDRYSKTTLNGAELPGLDPNRNSVQMDLFPTNLIDQIIVYKNFTPDLPGSFSGGLVDIRTNDFPDRLVVKAYGSLGYNTQASLNDNFLGDDMYRGEGLGFANEARDLPRFISNDLGGFIPAYPKTVSQLQENGPLLENAVRSFQSNFSPVKRTSGLNQNYGASIGNQHQLGGRPFGYIASLSYRRRFNYFQDGIRNQFNLPSSTSEILDPQAALNGSRGEEEVLWGGLLKLSYKPAKNHKVSLNAMYNQNATSFGEDFSGQFFSSGGDVFLNTRTVGYTERSIAVGQLEGEHIFGKLKADWIASLSKSSQYEPDLRFFANEVLEDGGTLAYQINNGNGYDNPLRFYRDMEEDNLDVKLNMSLPLKAIKNSDKGSLRFGGAYTRKQRDFGESRYELAQGDDAAQYDGDITKYTSESNLFTLPVDEQGQVIIEEWFQGLYYTTRTLPSNLFEAEQNIFAGYIMADLPLSSKLQLIGGFRFEQTDMRIMPDDSTLFEPILLEDPTANPGVLELNDLLPSLSLVYKMKEDMNVRVGYGRTLARPSIFEFSQFERLPYIGGPIYLGNPLLKRTLIDNFDARWEWFPSISELISVSGFYKNFQNPIELAQDFRTQNLRFQYVNRDKAFIYGAEIEVKKNLDFISDKLSKFQVGANAAFIYSQTELTAEEKENILAVDPERKTTRPLFGQSPYVINAELAFIDRERLDLQTSINLNIFGPRLFAVGGVAPDIYEQPRPALNFSISKGIGKYLSVRFRANNLLDPAYKFTQTFKEEDFTFRTNRVGRSFSLGLSFNL